MLAISLLLLASHPVRAPGDPTAPPVVLVAPPDVAALVAEDAARGPLPFRYGVLVEARVDAAERGRWDAEPGTTTWRVELLAPGARSLGVVFERFELPPGGTLCARDPSGTRVLGPFHADAVQANGGLATLPVPGERVVLEYRQPAESAAVPRLVIGSVVYDYRGLPEGLTGSVERDAELQQRCYVDVACIEGAPYQEVKRSVVLLVTGGTLCSGVLLANTSGSGDPLVLTAAHCGDMANVVAVFGYERPLCGSGTAPQTATVTGATSLAAASAADAQLVRLDHVPPVGFRPWYAGWSRAPAPSGPTAGIHHPEGLPKKITLGASAPLAVLHWWAAPSDVGMLFPGSSGSPLFDEGLHVLGPMTALTSLRCEFQAGLYTRLDAVWQELAPWLDPLGTGALALDGTGARSATATPYQGSGVNPDVYRAFAPVLGTAWSARVDASAHPATTATLLVGRLGASGGTIGPYGELLVDPASPRAFVSISAVSAGTSVHSAVLPADASLAGAVVHSQALLLGGAPRLTNGVTLRLF